MVASANYYVEIRRYPARPPGKVICNKRDLDAAMNLPAKIKIGGIEFSVQASVSRVDTRGGAYVITYPFQITQLSEWSDMGRFLEGVRSEETLLSKLKSAVRKIVDHVLSETELEETAFSLGTYISELQILLGTHVLGIAAEIAPKGVTVNISDPEVGFDLKPKFNVFVCIDADGFRG